MPVKRETRKLFVTGDVWVLAFFAAFHLLLFLQFPLNGNIPGNCDTWLVISLSNAYMHRIAAFFGGPATTAMFPVENIHAYGESAPGSAMLFILFKLLGFNDIVAYYLYISSIFFLTAYAVYRLTRLYIDHLPVAVFAGFAFTCSNFMFANIDDSVHLFFFPAVMSFYFLKRHLETAKRRHIILATLIGGSQIYFSMYIFIFQTLILGILILFHVKRLFEAPYRSRIAPFAALYLILPMPLFAFYLHSHFNLDVVNPFDIIANNPMAITISSSLNLFELGSVLKDNLVYPALFDMKDYLAFWPFIRRHAFIGVMVAIMGLFGLRAFNRGKAELACIGLAGFLISLGPMIQIGGFQIASPLALFYETIPLMTYFRIPLRSYFLSSLGLSILAAYALYGITTRLKWNAGKKAYIVVGAAMLIHFFENTPFPMAAYEIKDYYKAPESYLKYFEGKKGQTILDMPSDLGILFVDSDKSLFRYNREIIYINWQTQHRQNIVGGVNGYYPSSRLAIQTNTNLLPHPMPLAFLARAGVDHIVFHKNMVLPGEENVLANLERSRYLHTVLDNETLRIYKLDLEELRKILE